MSISKLIITASLFVSFAANAEQRFSQPPPNYQGAAIKAADVPDTVVVNRDTVRALLLAERVKNLDAFRAYQAAGVFPSNTFKDKSLNVWRDRDGHFCAAATIIRASGNVALVDKVAEQNNFIKLGDVKQGPVMDWILQSGLTQDEIAAIQEPFMPVYREQPVVRPDMRSAENQRLAAKYTTVTAMIQRNVNASLDAATDRLMKNRTLASQFVQTHAVMDVDNVDSVE